MDGTLRMRNIPLISLAALFTLVGFTGSALASETSAPFGFSWGPIDKIPKPSAAAKDANVTLLLYRGDRLPNGDMSDTEVVLVDVCKKEGLQQISWASKALSAENAAAKFVQIVAIGVQKYGESKSTAEGALTWENGRVQAISVSEPDGMHRVLMVSRGPEFDACSAEHDPASEQSLNSRWLRRFDLPK